MNSNILYVSNNLPQFFHSLRRPSFRLLLRVVCILTIVTAKVMHLSIVATFMTLLAAGSLTVHEAEVSKTGSGEELRQLPCLDSAGQRIRDN